jgi:hypothetical protein
MTPGPRIGGHGRDMSPPRKPLNFKAITICCRPECTKLTNLSASLVCIRSRRYRAGITPVTDANHWCLGRTDDGLHPFARSGHQYRPDGCGVDEYREAAAAVVTMRRTRSFAAAERGSTVLTTEIRCAVGAGEGWVGRVGTGVAWTKVATLRSVSDSSLRRRGLLTGSDATSGLSSRRHDAPAVSRPR